MRTSNRITLLLLLFSFSCKTEFRKTVEKYKSGNVKIEHVFPDKNDTCNYIVYRYYENKRISNKLKSVNCKFVDEKIAFYENGQTKTIEKLYSPVTFNDSLYDCEITDYFENGIIARKYAFKNGYLNGKQLDFDSSGKLIRSLDYKNGKLNGHEIHYYSTGKIKNMTEVRNDSAYGFEYDFTESGDTIRAIVHYGKTVNGIHYKKWLENGNILTASYKDSNRNFIIWRWVDRNNKILKTKVIKQKIGDNIAPE